MSSEEWLLWNKKQIFYDKSGISATSRKGRDIPINWLTILMNVSTKGKPLVFVALSWGKARHPAP